MTRILCSAGAVLTVKTGDVRVMDLPEVVSRYVGSHTSIVESSQLEHGMCPVCESPGVWAFTLADDVRVFKCLKCRRWHFCSCVV